MNRRLRILSVVPDLGFGGTQSRLLSFATTVDRDRFDHSVVTLLASDPDFDRRVGTLAQAYREAGVDVHTLGLAPRGLLPSRRPSAFVTAGVHVATVLHRLTALVRARDVDLVDAHHGAASLFGVIVGRLTGRPTTITQYFTDYWDGLVRRPAAHVVFGAADAFICDSRFQSDVINRWLRRPHPRAIVIPNGVPRPVASRTSGEMRRMLDIPADVPIVGQVGRLVPFKGQRVLLAAARLVAERRRDVFFLITGFSLSHPEYRQSLERDAAEAGIADRVRILSYPGPIGDIWAVIDIHVHPTLRDSLPIAITEGMALAKPAVVSAVSGIPEMVEHGRTGLVVPPDDPVALAESVLDLLGHPDQARKLGEAARDRYETRHRPEVMTRALETLFTDIVAESRAGRSEGWTRHMLPRRASAR